MRERVPSLIFTFQQLSKAAASGLSATNRALSLSSPANIQLHQWWMVTLEALSAHKTRPNITPVCPSNYQADCSSGRLFPGNSLPRQRCQEQLGMRYCPGRKGVACTHEEELSSHLKQPFSLHHATLHLKWALIKARFNYL